MQQDMNEAEFQQLREQTWRRKLTPEEEARVNGYLLSNADAQAGWEAEAGLTHLLGQLPDAPLASNFTAQVLRAIDRETATAARDDEARPAWWQWLHRRVPRLAWATLAAVCVIFAYAAFQYQQVRRTELAESVARVSTFAAAIDPEVFEDFEAIRRLSQVPADDSEFLAALSSTK